MTLTLTRPSEAHLKQSRTAKRPIGVSRGRQQIEKLTAQRTERRDARLYAEEWYQAIRSWEVSSYEVERPAGGGSGSGIEFVTSGEDGPLKVAYLLTPMDRDVNEGIVGSTITDMMLSGIPETVQLGKMLDKLRHERSSCMLSLLRGGSWSQHRERALRYGVAVLTLAVRLGDVHAERPLQHVRQELSQLPLVNSVQNC